MSKRTPVRKASVKPATKKKQVRSRTDSGLRVSEEKYRTLFNSIDEAFATIEVLFDKKGNPIDYIILETNPVFEKHNGISNAIGKRVLELVPTLGKFWIETFGKVAITGEPIRIEHYTSEVNRWSNVYAAKVGKGKSRQVVIVFSDITDRKRRESNNAFLTEIQDDLATLSSAEQIMSVTGAKIGSYLSVATSILVDVDESSNEARINYIWHTPDIPRLPDTVTISDFVSKDFNRLSREGKVVVVDDTEQSEITDRLSFRALKIRSFISVPFHRDGDWKFLLVVCDTRPRKWREDECDLFKELANRVALRVERARAFENMRLAEEKYKLALERAVEERTAELEESREALEAVNESLQKMNIDLNAKNLELSNFAFVASHDLREPLRKIKMFSNFIVEREHITLDEKGKEYFRKIEQAVKRMGALIDDILAFSRTNSTPRSEFVKVDLNKVVEDVKYDLGELIEERSATIECGDLPTLLGNPLQMSQLMQNLIGNAIKFQKPDGKPVVTVKTRRVVGREIKSPMAIDSRWYLELVVGDNGIGFNEQYSEQIFNMFQRLHAQSEYPGTGMGLAICKRVVENHEGFIVAKSKPGDGSQFYCYFPL